jgi:hypothetical protein
MGSQVSSNQILYKKKTAHKGMIGAVSFFFYTVAEAHVAPYAVVVIT